MLQVSKAGTEVILFFLISKTVVIAETEMSSVFSNNLSFAFFDASSFGISDRVTKGTKSEKGPKPLNYTNLDSWVFDIFILADETFATALRALETCALVNNNLNEKLFESLELPIIFYERFKVTWLPFLIPDFNLLSWKLDNFSFRVLYWVILFWYYIKAK